MFLQPHQVRDLIVAQSGRIKKLQEVHTKAVITIKKKFKEARSDESVSDDKMDKNEKLVIEKQDKIYNKALENLKGTLDDLMIQRDQMLKSLELPAHIEELIESI